MTALLSYERQRVIPRLARALAHRVAGGEFTARYMNGKSRPLPLMRAIATAFNTAAGCMDRFDTTPMSDHEAEKIGKVWLLAKDVTPMTKPKKSFWSNRADYDFDSEGQTKRVQKPSPKAPCKAMLPLLASPC